MATNNEHALIGQKLSIYCPDEVASSRQQGLAD